MALNNPTTVPVVIDGDTYHVRNAFSFFEMGRIEKTMQRVKAGNDEQAMLDHLAMVVVSWSHPDTLNKDNLQRLPLHHTLAIQRVVSEGMQTGYSLAANVPLVTPSDAG